MFDRVTAAVRRVFCVVLNLRAIHHGYQCHAEIDAQTVDVEKPEERQRREDNHTRGELYSVTPSSSVYTVTQLTLLVR